MFTASQIAWFSVVAGCLLLAHSHNRRYYISNLLKRGIKTEGKVVELRKDPGALPDGREGKGYAPVVEYATVSGNVLKHFSSTYRQTSPYKVGQTVPIWYINYKSIREAALADDEPGDLPKKLFIAGLLLLIIGVPFIVDGISTLFP